MLFNTKSLFLSLLRVYKCNLVMDIGSRDGGQALAFRDMLPEAQVVAFEANPFNFAAMARNAVFQDRRITILPLAISNVDGTVLFHITDVDYDAPDTADNNRGTSSTLELAGLRIKESIHVKSSRLDTFISENHPSSDAVALWIDVEAAEYFILEGMSGIRNRVKVVHVETAHSPMRKGQICFKDLNRLMTEWSFQLVGSNIREGRNWGDVVFVHGDWRRESYWPTTMARLKSQFAYFIHVDKVAACLKNNNPRLYALCRRIFLRGIG